MTKPRRSAFSAGLVCQGSGWQVKSRVPANRLAAQCAGHRKRTHRRSAAVPQSIAQRCQDRARWWCARRHSNLGTVNNGCVPSALAQSLESCARRSLGNSVQPYSLLAPTLSHPAGAGAVVSVSGAAFSGKSKYPSSSSATSPRRIASARKRS